MVTDHPQFAAPPVTETVLGVQFNTISGWSAAHAGLFWAKCLDDHWVQARDAAPIAVSSEKFPREWTPPQITIQEAGELGSRTQLVHENDERLIQLQDSWFVYNWLRRKGDYPSYDKLVPEFESAFDKFRRFVADQELGTIAPSQFDVTYVNHIPKGELWESLVDWKQIFPGLEFPGAQVDGLAPDSLSASWQLVIGENRGRLNVSLQHAQDQSTKGEIILLRLTAKGSIDEDKGYSVRECLDLGHKSVVDAFVDMTSESAHQHWKRGS